LAFGIIVNRLSVVPWGIEPDALALSINPSICFFKELKLANISQHLALLVVWQVSFLLLFALVFAYEFRQEARSILICP